MENFKKALGFSLLCSLLFCCALVQAQMYTHHKKKPEDDVTGKYTAKIKECGKVPCDAEIEIKEKLGDAYHFSIGAGHPGPMPSICNLEGDFTLWNKEAHWKSKTTKCNLTFAFEGPRVNITAKDASACQSECGAGAGFLGTYNKAH